MHMLSVLIKSPHPKPGGIRRRPFSSFHGQERRAALSDGLNALPHPGLLSKEKENHSPRLWKNQRRARSRVTSAALQNAAKIQAFALFAFFARTTPKIYFHSNNEIFLNHPVFPQK
jgi:hypothetical protein